MSIARHRLDVLLLPPTPEDAAWAPAAVARLTAAGRWPDDVLPGATARLVTPGGVRFVGNRQGGFFVRCPVRGDNLAKPFSATVEAWRTGAPRSLICPCGQTHDLDALTFSPPAGFAAAWIAIEDAPSPDPDLIALLGPHRVVWQRG